MMFKWLFTCTNYERKCLYATIRNYKKTIVEIESAAAASSKMALDDHDRMTKALVGMLDDMARIVEAKTLDEARQIAIDRTGIVRDTMIDAMHVMEQRKRELTKTPRRVGEEVERE